MTNCTRCGEPKDVHDAGENYACQAQPTVTFQEEADTEAEAKRFINDDFGRLSGMTSAVDRMVACFVAGHAFAMTNARDGTE